MKILFTGASSFTGFWFVHELAANGHEVWTTFTRKNVTSYDGVRAERLKRLEEISTLVWACPFGSDAFLNLVNQENHWDVLCHHAADVRDYHSLDFSISSALSNNTENIRLTLDTLVKRNCEKIILTGSVFEQNEGAGEVPLHAFSPYGLSKGFTAEIFKFWCDVMNITLGKFVIPNPFGPYEEPRFTAYLAKTWLKGELAGVRTPLYVRDNIHVSLLAKSYNQFLQSTVNSIGFHKLNPSGYVESQGAFAMRFASEMRNRFNLACELELGHQAEFDEPKVRINTDQLNTEMLAWDEEKAWDDLATYYLS